MNALTLMEDVNTIVPIQLVATIAHVMAVILLIKMVTVACVRDYIRLFITVLEKII